MGSNNTVAGFGLCTMGDYESSEGNESWPASRQKAIEKVISAVCRRYKLGFEKISYHQNMAWQLLAHHYVRVLTTYLRFPQS